MQRVRVQKQKLTEIVEKNRAEHKEVFTEATEKYRLKVVELLAEQLVLAQEKKEFDLGKVRELTEPESHVEDYDRVLEMLTMSVDDVVELSAAEFANYVQDRWQWSRAWALSNSGYSDNAKVRAFSRRE